MKAENNCRNIRILLQISRVLLIENLTSIREWTYSLKTVRITTLIFAQFLLEFRSLLNCMLFQMANERNDDVTEIGQKLIVPEG